MGKEEGERIEVKERYIRYIQATLVDAEQNQVTRPAERNRSQRKTPLIADKLESGKAGGQMEKTFMSVHILYVPHHEG